MMLNNKKLLQALAQAIDLVHPTIVKRLNAGLSEDEIDKVASSYQLTFTDEIYDLFTWKNGIQHEGVSSTAQLLLFPNGIPFALNEAAQEFNSLSVAKHFFEPNYFPLFSGGNDDLLLIDLDEDSNTFKMISLYSPALLGNSDPVTIYDSFQSMLATAISCYVQKAFWIDNYKLKVDSDAHYRVVNNLNPNSGYWQYM